MTTARIFLSGIRASGHHGARPGEKDEPQELVVDLDLDVEAASDAIGATADYRTISDLVRRVIEQRSFDLIETIAEVVATEVIALPNVEGATVVVHKPNAARRLGIDGVAAAVSLGRDR